MNTNPGLLQKEEVYRVVGAALEVLNGVGHGLSEKPYENALVVEFNLRDIPYKQQPQYKVLYKGYEVGGSLFRTWLRSALWWSTRK